MKCLWDRKKSSTTVNEAKSIRVDFREVIRGLVRRLGFVLTGIRSYGKKEKKKKRSYGRR